MFLYSISRPRRRQTTSDGCSLQALQVWNVKSSRVSNMSSRYSADPFPHWVIDEFLPQEDAWAAYEHFHDAGGLWTRRHHLYSRHKETRAQGLPEAVERVLQRLEGEA